MVSLVCRDSCRANAPSLRVWFLVDTSVYGTYLAQKTVDALAPNVGTAPSALLVAIQVCGIMSRAVVKFLSCGAVLGVGGGNVSPDRAGDWP